jgi:ribosomal protein L17
MPRAKIHADSTARRKAHAEAIRDAGMVRKSVTLTPARQATVSALREAWGMASDQALFDRLVDDAAKKFARAKRPA